MVKTKELSGCILFDEELGCHFQREINGYQFCIWNSETDVYLKFKNCPYRTTVLIMEGER